MDGGFELGSRWTREEDNEVRRIYASGELVKDGAARMGRTKNQVIGRAYRLGLGKAEASEDAKRKLKDHLSPLLSRAKKQWHERNPGEADRIMAIARAARKPSKAQKDISDE